MQEQASAKRLYWAEDAAAMIAQMTADLDAKEAQPDAGEPVALSDLGKAGPYRRLDPQTLLIDGVELIRHGWFCGKVHRVRTSLVQAKRGSAAAAAAAALRQRLPRRLCPVRSL